MIEPDGPAPRPGGHLTRRPVVADRSYCIETPTGGSEWTYGKAEGTVNAAAGAVTTGQIWWW